MSEGNIKFKYQKITNHYLGQRMHMFKYVGGFFALILLVVEVLNGSPYEYSIKSYVVIFSLLSFSLIMHFFLKPYDAVLVMDKYLVIKKYGKQAMKFRLDDMTSFSSTTKLVLEFNNGETETISYSKWLFPMRKVQELSEVLKDEIGSNIVPK